MMLNFGMCGVYVEAGCFLIIFIIIAIGKIILHDQHISLQTFITFLKFLEWAKYTRNLIKYE